MIKWIGGESLQTSHVNPSSPVERIWRSIASTLRADYCNPNAIDAFEITKGFERHSWDRDVLQEEHPLRERFWENPSLQEQKLPTFLN